MNDNPTDGPAPLTIYDLSIDARRPVTQIDIDQMVERINQLDRFWRSIVSDRRILDGTAR